MCISLHRQQCISPKWQSGHVEMKRRVAWRSQGPSQLRVIATCSCNTGHQPLGVPHCYLCLRLQSVRTASVQRQSVAYRIPFLRIYGSGWQTVGALFHGIIILLLWHRIIWYVIRYSEERVVSNFKVEDFHFGGIWYLNHQGRSVTNVSVNSLPSSSV